MPYTSGTTGKPKGCIHTHRTVMSTTIAGSAWVGMDSNSVVLCTMPLFHVTGMQCSMNQPIYRGATIVLMTRWDRDTAAELIQRYKVDGWTNITTMAIDFLSNPDLGRYDITSIRHIGGGGAAMPEAVAQRLQDRTGLCLHRGLRTVGDHRAHAHQPASAHQKAMPGHSDLLDGRARDQPGHPEGTWPEGGRRDRLQRSADLPRLLEESRTPRRPVSSNSGANASSAPATSATTTRTVTFSSSIGSSA